MSKKIYDATKISQAEANFLFTSACYFGDTKDEVRNKEQAGVLIRWTEEGFEFAGIFGRYKYLQESVKLSRLVCRVREQGKVGERMLKGYWTFLRSFGICLD